MKKEFLKNFISWSSAFVCAFVVINLMCFVYNRDTAGVFRNGGALAFAYQPDTLIINNSEGNGWARVDKNGYLNESAELSDDGYILVLGNSMTNAVQVAPDEKYVSVLNSHLQEKYGDEKVRAYLMARGGADFVELAQGYSAAVTEFPDAKAVVIQIIDGRVSMDSLDGVKEQREYKDSQKPDYILKNKSANLFIRCFVKNYVPIVYFVLEKRLNNFTNPLNGVFIYRKSASDVEYYTVSRDVKSEIAKLTETLNFLNGLDDKKIIILNLPSENIKNNGELSISNDGIDIWEQACLASGVRFVDMTDEWKGLYTDQNKLAFGFSNTSPANGHMNKYGHKAVGERLYKEIFEMSIFQ